jgi:hypothetical protein
VLLRLGRFAGQEEIKGFAEELGTGGAKLYASRTCALVAGGRVSARAPEQKTSAPTVSMSRNLIGGSVVR